MPGDSYLIMTNPILAALIAKLTGDSPTGKNYMERPEKHENTPDLKTFS